ncbi:hypothetical protein CTH_10027 (plasmid) [Carboxydocella thermautotrophica]|nr:hypothetical protein CTH_10027 [Carboxydocella thermautotrophica]
MYFFIDESGYNGDYIFTAVCVKDPAIAKSIIKKWRDWMKKRKKGFCQNEYHDTKANDDERRKILNTIAEYTPEELRYWAVLRVGYNGKHKELYVPTIIELLQHCGITENDVVIAVDNVEKNQKHMDKHIRNIKKGLGMPRLNICGSNSEKEKGLQVADAIAGSLCREYVPRPSTPSYLEKIIHLMADDIKIIR